MLKSLKFLLVMKNKKLGDRRLLMLMHGLVTFGEAKEQLGMVAEEGGSYGK